MNKSFLLIASIFGFIFSAIYGYAMIMLLYLLTIFGYGELSLVDVMGYTVIGGFIAVLVGSFRINWARNHKVSQGEVIFWSLILLFSTFIGGVFGLIGAFSNEDKNQQANISTLEGRLSELNRMFDKGLISEDEYKRRRKIIIES